MAQLNSLIVTGKSRFLNEISGVIETASKLGTSTVGGTTTPIYLNGGVPTALGYTIAKSVPSNAVFTDTNNAVTQTATTTDANYEVLFSATADNTTRTEGAGKAATLRFNPNIGSIMEGDSTVATGDCSHAEGLSTCASGMFSHAEGCATIASGNYGAHAEGCDTTASGEYGAHAEGYKTSAAGLYSHAEGGYTTANGMYSHSEGSNSCAYGESSHVEGKSTFALSGAHAEGNSTTAYGVDSHTEGTSTSALGTSAHAEGAQTTAYGEFSHAEGFRTYAVGDGQHVMGKYNATDNNQAFIIGGGTSNSAKKNIFTVNWNGTAYAAGGFQLPIDPTSTEIANFPSGTMWIQTT